MRVLLFLGLLTTVFAQSKLRFIVIGNWGDNTNAKESVANAMNEWAAENKVAFILSTGDNFYPEGVTSPDDPQFNTGWKNYYNQEHIADLPWYISLGNRDHDDDLREWNQVYYSASEKRFNFPQLTYSFVGEAREAMALFVVIDTQSLRQNKNDKEYMLNYLDRKLRKNDADWLVVIGHHPAYSCGGQSGSSTIRDEVVPILQNRKVDFYLSGHDHNMQHFQVKNDLDVDYFQSGSGGRPLFSLSEERLAEEEARGMELQHFEEEFGFMYFEMDEKRTRVTWVSDSGEELYFYERES